MPVLIVFWRDVDAASFSFSKFATPNNQAPLLLVLQKQKSSLRAGAFAQTDFGLMVAFLGRKRLSAFSSVLQSLRLISSKTELSSHLKKRFTCSVLCWETMPQGCILL